MDDVVIPTLRYKLMNYFTVEGSVEAGASVGAVGVPVVIGDGVSVGATTCCVSGETGCSPADTIPARDNATRTAMEYLAIVTKCFLII
jgi:hypothetical protein